jgi:hypothetical protein
VREQVFFPFRHLDGGGIVLIMASEEQRSAAQRNIKRAAGAAKKERTIAKLPKRVRTALGKEGAKAARRKRAR